MTEKHPPSSPYRPGFNQAPMVLAGRGEVLAGADEAIALAAFDRRTPQPLLLVGARGVGKTVLLGEIAGRAGATHGWPHVHLEITPSASFAPQLLQTVASVMEQLEGGPGRRRLRATTRFSKPSSPGSAPKSTSHANNRQKLTQRS